MLLRQRHREEGVRNDRLKRELALEQAQPIRTAGATPAGDTRRLRGIPVIARGVAGAMRP